MKKASRLGFTLLGLAVVVSTVYAQRSQTAVEARIDDLKTKLDRGEKLLIIDVRREDEVRSGSIPDAVNIPMAELETRMKDIAKDVQVVFVCDHGAEVRSPPNCSRRTDTKPAPFARWRDGSPKATKRGNPKA